MDDKMYSTGMGQPPPPPLMGTSWQQSYNNQQQDWSNVNWQQYYAYYNQLTTQMANTPPGFGNNVLLPNNQNNQPPLPPGPPPQGSGTFSYPIKFNLKSSNRFHAQAPNPLESPQRSFSNQQNNNASNQFLSKNQRKKKNKKNKQQQQTMGWQTAPPAPSFGGPIGQPKEMTPPPPPDIKDVVKPPPPVSPQEILEPTPARLPNPFNNPTDAWPESLNNYVNRCYSKCKTKFDKDQVEIVLKGKITMAANKGSLFTTDWDSEPTPSVHSERLCKDILKTSQPIIGTVKNVTPSKTSKKSLKSNDLDGPKYNIKDKQIENEIKADKSRSPKYSSRRRSRSSSCESSFSSNKRKSRRRSDSVDSNDKTTHKQLYSSSSKKLKKQKNINNKKKIFLKPHGQIGGDVEGDREKLKERAQRFKQQLKKAPQQTLGTFDKKRLQIPAQKNFFFDDSCRDDGFDVLADLHIVGTCRDLEKPFLRLTKAPSPSEVRPEEVLVYSLANVKERWKVKQEYFFACDQLKSIRQDLTVSLVPYHHLHSTDLVKV